MMSIPDTASVWLMDGGQHFCIMLLIFGMKFSMVMSAPSQYLESLEQRETWLSDQVLYDLEEKESLVSNELCPPVPIKTTADSCTAPPCRSDTECTGGQLRCCYNGCVFTCLPPVNPAPHFDWINEPVRQIQFGVQFCHNFVDVNIKGQSWLVPGPNDDPNVEMCSTTLPDDDSDPLICPHGYVCSIDDVGTSVEQEESTNQGRCVKIEDDIIVKHVPVSEIQNDQPVSDDHYDTALQHACLIDEGQLLLSGHSLMLDGQKCLCQDTKLNCSD